MLKWIFPLGAFLVTITIGYYPTYSLNHESHLDEHFKHTEVN